MTRGLRLLSSVVVTLTVGASSLSSQSIAGSEEYRLKAAFLLRFPQFVEWPPAALEGRSSLQICVSEPNPFGEVLLDLLEGETLNGLPLEVREIEPGTKLDGCHVLFVTSRGSAAATKALLDDAAKRPLLTVGESPRFLDDGGIISLRIVDRRVRFEVNAEAAGRVGLRLSSQLLRLAIAVRGTAA